MTNLKIEERKNTTEAGLKELKALTKSFSFDPDIATVESGNFFAEADIGGEQEYVWTDTGIWKITRGFLILKVCSETYYSDNWKKMDISYLQKINFARALEELENVITKYNERVLEKDGQIETFLKFCSEFKK